jgi:capsid protein
MSMTARVSRRELATLALGAAAASAQTPARPASEGDDLAEIREHIKRNFEEMAKVELPMSTEPAAYFRA